MKLQQFLRAVVCAVIVVLCVAGTGWFPIQPAPVRAALQGEAAIQLLKTDGTYASLAAAIAEARFQSSASSNPPGTVSSDAGQPLMIDSILTQQRRLMAMDAAAVDQFGNTVALSGNTAVIGAPSNDFGENFNQGSVYVFVRNGTGWSQQQKLTASDGEAGDQFGFAVALSGDTLAVGAVNVGESHGAVYVFTRSGEVWTQQPKIMASDGAAGDFFGSALALNGDTLVAAASFDDVGANMDQGSAYVFVRNGTAWMQQQQLIANDGAPEDQFGFRVALSGNTVVVGAPLDDIGPNANQGSAYVFVRGGNVWSQQQQLLGSDGAAQDLFGCSVALSGETAAVGARQNDFGQTSFDQGAVYVFVRTGTAWITQQQIRATNGAAFDQFGQSVALSGDLLVIGAAKDDVNQVRDQGSAYVFVRSGTTWSQQRNLFPDESIPRTQSVSVATPSGDESPGVEFGFAVALSGDTVLVGAPNETGAFIRQGAAYVFVINANSQIQQPQLIANDGSANEDFGFSVAINGNTVVVGARNDDIGVNADQGSAYIFIRNGTSWTQQQRLTANDGAAGDSFGSVVAISGDTVAIGARGDDIGTKMNQGSVYIFTRTGTVWTEQQRLIYNDGLANDVFGSSIALSGNLIVIGAPGEVAGAAYVFARGGNSWVQQQRLVAVDGENDDEFGSAVALNGDTIVVGAAADDIGTKMEQGSSYVFIRTNAIWQQQQKLTADDGASRDNFGNSVALSGDTLVIGAIGDPRFLIPSKGAAYVFTRSGTNWTVQQKLTANDGALMDRFGYQVALSGDLIVVGAQLAEINTVFDQGTAYIFTRSGNAWTQQQQKLIASDGAARDNFGTSVALSGDTIVVGAFGNDVGANVNQGSAYVFVCAACPAVTLDPASLPDAQAGASYSQTLTASSIGGGTGLHQFSFSDGALPPGLSLARNGQLSGTPTAGGTYQFTVTATLLDTLCSGSRSYTLTVAAPCPALTINPQNLPPGVSGAAYSQQLSSSGGAALEGFAVMAGAGALPLGLTLTPTGLLSGTLTNAATGPYNFTITAVMQGSQCPASRDYTLTVTCPTFTLNPASLPGGQAGVAYEQQLSGSDGATPNSFVVTAGALPPGLSLSQSGLLSGMPTAAGTFNFTITGIILNIFCPGSRSYTLIVIPGCPTVTIVPSSLPAGVSGVAYRQQLSASGGTAPYRFAMTGGSLPGGLTLTPEGLLSGNPFTSISFPFNFIVQATDANGCLGQREYALFVTACPNITVNPDPLPVGTVGAIYQQLLTGSGGAAPYSLSITEGALPDGLALVDGALTGTPTVAGSFSFTVQATDANGCQGGRAYAVTINGGAANNGLQFYPLAHPVRLLDTRPGQLGCFTPGAPIAGGTSRTQPAQGSCDGLDIPVSARAVTGNITTVTSDGGYLTLYPGDAQPPLVASSNYAANEVINNVFTVGLGTAGQDAGAFKIFASNTTDVVVDITGYYAPPAETGLYFHPLPKPIRLLETRPGQTGCTAPGVPLAGNADTPQQARLSCDGVTIPAAALAIVGNATTVSPEGLGYLTLFPAGAARPLAASSNYDRNQVINGPFTVGLSAAGEFNIFTTATTHLVVDVLGYYSPEANDVNGAGLLFNPLSKPVRLLETRAGQTGCFTPGAPLAANTELPQIARGTCQGETIPAAALAIAGNATVVNPQGGFLTFWPSNAARPLAATSNFNAGQVFNRHFVVGLGADGAFKMYSQFQTDLVVDVTGYFAP